MAQIVDKRSAVLGLAGSREEIIALEADHSNLCKYESAEDPLYIQVAGNIKSMMRKIILQGAASQQKEHSEQTKLAGGESSARCISTGMHRQNASPR